MLHSTHPESGKSSHHLKAQMGTDMIDTGNSSRVSIAWLVLLLALFAAGITYWQSREMAERELATQIDLRAEQARYALDKEIGRHVEVLRGLQAQFMVYPDISFRSFQQLNEVLTLDQHLPGVQAVAFTRRVAPGGLEAFEEGARRELDGDPLGYPPPLVHPRAAGREAYVVQYCEPVLRNPTGVWFDQGSEAKRREAIERARDTGEWSATARIRLAVAPTEVDGVIIFLPVYRGGAVPATLEQRRERFFGAVLLVIRIEEMLRHAFGPGLLGELDIAVYDMVERAGPGPQGARRGLIFDSGGAAPADSGQAGAPQLPARRGYDLDLGGGMWRMEVRALPTLVKRTQYWLAPAAASAVFLLGLLVFRFVRALERSRSRLREKARSIEQTLQSREQQIARIIDSIDAALWRVEMPGGRLSYVSAAVERITGHPPQAFYDDRRLWMDSIHPDDRAQVRAMARRVQSSGRETFHYRVVRPGGEVRWIHCEAHFVAGAQAGTGCIEGIDSDITEQRQLEESLRRSNRALRAIHDCEAAIATVDDERQLLQRICDVAVQAGYRMAWAGVLADDGSLRIRPLGQAGEHGDYLETIGPLLETGRLEPFHVMREAIDARRPRMVDDFEADGVPPVLREQVLRRGWKSKVVLPMVHDDTVLGVLNVYGAEPDAFDAEAVALLTDMAQSLAVALQALRDRSGRRAAEEMARLRERAIEACANAIIIASAQPPDYPIEYVNSAFERMTGYAAAEMIGRSPRAMHGQDGEQPGLVELRRLLHE
ncbi:MAG TPA: CHASE domain-containing protein, partial [Noviherbaspirillum sp.]|nr:CHASE domain-containing protein [Noviherbaspirillum sp.]